MTEKRFTDVNISYEEDWIRLKDNGLFLIFPIHYTDKEEYGLPTLEDLLNELNDENEQLKKDNNHLIHLLENQSMIIQELYSKLMHYELKEPIVLTKEDLELMDKAISYYTHGRCVE